jgi:hypothetical protein
MTNAYELGDLVRCTGELATSEGVDTDPSGDVIAQIKAPDGTETTYTYGTDGELVKLATGLYYVDVDVTAGGRWTYRFHSTGAGQAAGESFFRAKRSAFS